MSLCARAILLAQKIDPEIPLCKRDCPIKGPADLRRQIHDKCEMSLTTPAAMEEGLHKKVMLALEKSNIEERAEGPFEVGLDLIIGNYVENQRKERLAKLKAEKATEKRKIYEDLHSGLTIDQAIEKLREIDTKYGF